MTQLQLKQQQMDYYDVPALSASGINQFFKSPLHFWKSSPFNPEKESFNETPSTILGRLCHLLLLEPEEFDRDFIVCNSGTRTKAFKEAQEANPKQTVISEEMYTEAKTLVAAVKNNKVARQLLTNGLSEGELYWKHGELDCKCKIDYYRDGLVLDYKTSTAADKNSFSKSIANYGYHRQAAWYLGAVEKATGTKQKGFVFLVQDKTLPDAIGIYCLDDDALESARYENAYAVEEISKRLENNDWQAFPNLIERISLPYWYKLHGVHEDE